MRSGIKFEQGEIVLVPVPFTNLRASKKRPVLVLSNTSYNSKSRDFLCCGITSNKNNVRHSVLIENKDLLSGSLPKPSRVKFNTVFTLEKSIVIGSFGNVRADIMERVKKELFALL